MSGLQILPKCQWFVSPPLRLQSRRLRYFPFPAHSSPAEIVNELLSAGFDPNQPDSFGRTPLHWAALLLDWDLFSTLISHGSSLQARSLVPRFPFHFPLDGQNAGLSLLPFPQRQSLQRLLLPLRRGFPGFSLSRLVVFRRDRPSGPGVLRELPRFPPRRVSPPARRRRRQLPAALRRAGPRGHLPHRPLAPGRRRAPLPPAGLRSAPRQRAGTLPVGPRAAESAPRDPQGRGGRDRRGNHPGNHAGSGARAGSAGQFRGVSRGNGGEGVLVAVVARAGAAGSGRIGGVRRVVR